jgi:hypothetical protein
LYWEVQSYPLTFIHKQNYKIILSMWMEYSIDVAIIFHPSGNKIPKIFSYAHKSEAHMFTSSWFTLTCSHGNDIVLITNYPLFKIHWKFHYDSFLDFFLANGMVISWTMIQNNQTQNKLLEHYSNQANFIKMIVLSNQLFCLLCWDLKIYIYISLIFMYSFFWKNVFDPIQKLIEIGNFFLKILYY